MCRQWAGCGSDNRRNLVAATEMGLVDSPVVELFDFCRIYDSLAGNIAFLEGHVFVFVAGLARFLAEHSLRALQQEKAISVTMCMSQNHNTHDAHNRTAKEAKGDAWNARVIARELGGTRYQLETPRRTTNVASGRLTKPP